MSYESESLRSLTKNERPWAICSDRSEEMSDREQIIQVAHQKRVNEWIAHFLRESLIRSFLDKKRTICSDIKWANSQPWLISAFEKYKKLLLFHFSAPLEADWNDPPPYAEASKQ